MQALGLGGGAAGAAMGLGVSGSAYTGSVSGDAAQFAGYEADDFNVNFGNGVSQGGGLPTWVFLLAAVVGVYAWKRFS